MVGAPSTLPCRGLTAARAVSTPEHVTGAATFSTTAARFTYHNASTYRRA